MRVVLQRVKEASVTVEGEVVARIGHGALLLVGFLKGDDAVAAELLAKKIAALRIFEDAEGRTNRGFEEAGGAVLAVSQFTLAADTSRGRRPSFENALEAEAARSLFEHFAATLETLLGKPVPRGVFAASMQVALVNDGPFTLVLEQLPAGK